MDRPSKSKDEFATQHRWSTYSIFGTCLPPQIVEVFVGRRKHCSFGNLPQPAGGLALVMAARMAQAARDLAALPVSASTTAAALALDLVLAWNSGNPGPRFRTRVLYPKQAFQVKDMNLSPSDACLACGNRKL